MVCDTAASLSRRGFLHAGLGLAGGVFTLGTVPVIGGGRSDVARWVLMADTHVPADQGNNYRGSFPYRNLARAVEQIGERRPEGILVAGDLARLEGLTGDYANLRTLLTPLMGDCPTYLALGNHDHRDNFRRAFADRPGGEQDVQGRHVAVVDTGPVRLVVLDSLMYVNKTPGLLGKAQRQWLDRYLQDVDDKPVVLCLHHTLGDGDGDLLDVPRLFEIVRPCAKVKAIVFGHSHTYRFSELDGIHLINLPALGYNFNDAQPVGWVEARFKPVGVELILHAIAGNADLDGRSTTLRWRS